MPDSVTPVNDDTALWEFSNGNWLQPSGNYIINYKAILSWLSNTGANPFPAQLRSGNILYYTRDSPPTCRPPPTTYAVLELADHQPGPAFLERIYRLRDRRLVRSGRQRSDARQFGVQLRPRLCLRRRHRGEHQRAGYRHEIQRHRLRRPDR